jgi:para-aminobenzoate synthetase/4-amino-4-deoxychorismate lyase
VKAALEAHARGFAEGTPRKVRLVLEADGRSQITDKALSPRSGNERIGRVQIAEQRTNPADRMLYHKTTQRPLYARAFEQGARNGFDDVLFLNLCGELTEGAISNVFIETDGRWFTPPVECGLLPGVYRRHLLETRPEIEERVLTLDDLRTADAIYLANAVRGLRSVEIIW